MGIFFNSSELFKKKPILEMEINGEEQDTGEDEDYNAPDEGDETSETGGGEGDTSSGSDDGDDDDYTDGADTAGDEPAEGDEGSDEGDEGSSDDDDDYTAGADTAGDEPDAGGDEGSDEGEGDSGESGEDDYTSGIDTAGDEPAEGEEGSDEGESSEGEEGDSEGGEEPEDSFEALKKIEAELFSSLTPEQIAIKNAELKQRFIDIYTTIGNTLGRINDVPKSDDNIETLKFITDKLLELREMIDFNITTAYQTRTYIENNIIYQQCLSTLNAICDIISSIHSPAEEENEDVDNDDSTVEDELTPKESNTLDIGDGDGEISSNESYNIYI